MQTTHNVTYHANHTQCDIPCKPHTMRHTMQTTHNATYHANNTQCDIPCKQHTMRHTMQTTRNTNNITPGPRSPHAARARRGGGSIWCVRTCAHSARMHATLRRHDCKSLRQWSDSEDSEDDGLACPAAAGRAVVLEGGACGGPARGNTHAHTHTHTHTHIARRPSEPLHPVCERVVVVVVVVVV